METRKAIEGMAISEERFVTIGRYEFRVVRRSQRSFYYTIIEALTGQYRHSAGWTGTLAEVAENIDYWADQLDR